MRFWREQRGSAAVMVGVMSTALVAFAALAVDVGHLYNVRAHLSATADMAARAGAQLLPTDRTGAAAAARQVAVANGVSATEVQTAISADQTTVTVSVRRTVPLTFARIMTLDTADVSATAAAQNAALSGVQGAVPFAVVKQAFTYGMQVTLKQGSGSSVGPGNYQAVTLGASGANNYRANVMNGYGGWLRSGDWIETEPGNMSGPTRQGVDYRLSQDPNSTFDQIASGSPRVLTVPVVDSFDVNGRGQVQVVGFAAFFLEGMAGNGQVNGRFIRYLTEGEVSGGATYYGTGSVKLVR